MNIFETQISFNEKAISAFRFQFENNPVYQRFCKALGIQKANDYSEIPLLPIQAFKEKQILTTENPLEIDFDKLIYFQSSGTSGMQKSTHYLLDTDMYKKAGNAGMKHFYELDDYVIWAYTPGYNPNPHSSLGLDA